MRQSEKNHRPQTHTTDRQLNVPAVGALPVAGERSSSWLLPGRLSCVSFCAHQKAVTGLFGWFFLNRGRVIWWVEKRKEGGRPD